MVHGCGTASAATFRPVSIDDLFFDEVGPTIKRQRRGPHWRQDGKLYFVTWRQADSIPREQREEIERERAAWQERHSGVPLELLPEGSRRAYLRLYHKRVQQFLDAGYGSCVLKQKAALDIMLTALHHFEGSRYRLGSFAVAGNHVHVLVTPFPGIDLSQVQHSWKSFTANAINKALGLNGPLWRPESYDRIVRDQNELERIEDYILGHAHQGHHVEKRETDRIWTDLPINAEEQSAHT
jgi:hypothetical protein